jgi:hypothetical protein
MLAKCQGFVQIQVFSQLFIILIYICCMFLKCKRTFAEKVWMCTFCLSFLSFFWRCAPVFGTVIFILLPFVWVCAGKCNIMCLIHHVFNVLWIEISWVHPGYKPYCSTRCKAWTYTPDLVGYCWRLSNIPEVSSAATHWSDCQTT